MTDRYDALRKALEAGPSPGPYSYYCGEDESNWGDFFPQIEAPDGVIVGNEGFYSCRDRDIRNARFLAACDPGTIQSLLSDADRYNAFFVAGLHITFMGEEYCTKKDLDAAIDAFLAGQKGGAT